MPTAKKKKISSKKTISKKTQGKKVTTKKASSQRKKKNSWAFFEKKIINLPIVKKEERTLLIITFLIFCLTLIIFWEIRKPQTVIVVMPPEAAANNQEKNNDIIKIGAPVYWYSFGDSFTSSARLNTEQTDMYLEDGVAAFMFPPQYDFVFRDCVNCQLAENNISLLNKSDYRNDLASMPSPLPIELEGKEILAAKIDNLTEKKIASFVVRDGSEERAFVYFLNGNNYEPLITNKTEEKIITKYGRQGGIVTAGGSDDNFIILYSGYEGSAYHYLAGKLYDISKFFSIRVMNEGFMPYIIKQGEGNETIWYVLSQEEGKNRLVKLWQNGGRHIKGSVDLSLPLSQQLAGRTITAFASSDEGDIDFLTTLDGREEVLTFYDKGFDNNKVRQVVSKNINTKNYPVYKAIIKSLGVCLIEDEDISYHTSFPNDQIDIYIGDSMSNFKKIVPKSEVSFSGNNHELYFRLVFYPTSENINYSPWLDNINDLAYLVSF